MSRGYSVIQFFPEDPGHSCGYCKSTDGFVAQGAWAHELNVADYQRLIDRGWRRSGRYCYKPVMDKMCCPLYTIRCHAPEVQLTKSQKKVAKRMQNFLLHSNAKLNQVESSAVDAVDGSLEHGHMDLDIDAETLEKMASRASGDLPQGTALLSGDLTDSPRAADEVSASIAAQTEAGATAESVGPPAGQKAAGQLKRPQPTEADAARRAVQPGNGADPAQPPCRKKKALRRERWRKKHGDAPVPPPPAAPAPVPLEQLLLPPDSAKHKLELRLVCVSPRSEEFVSTKAASYQVYKEYQMAVHGDTEDKCSMTTYERFLCATPLKGDPPYGTYHQQYWMDGQLIAVGVLDVLPACVSSKYFYYLPRFGFLSLGTYSSLRELELTRRLHQSLPELRYYYMGYYIHTCPKMRYKGRLSPSDLLCPETLTWHPISSCVPLLDRKKYARFAPPGPAAPEPDVMTALVLYRGRPMTYRRYLQLTGARDQDEIRQYLRLVGPRVAAQTLVHRE